MEFTAHLTLLSFLTVVSKFFLEYILTVMLSQACDKYCILVELPKDHLELE